MGWLAERRAEKYAARLAVSAEINRRQKEQDRRAGDPHYTFAGPKKGWVKKK